MSELTLNELMRCTSVTRWHIVRTLRQQSVAEHQWAVAIIAMDLVERLQYLVADGAMMQIVSWALLHDSVEVITGDIPSPVSAQLKPSIALLSELSSQRWTQLRQFARTHDEGAPEAIVKLADLIADWAFLDVEALGQHAHHVGLGLKDRIVSYAVDSQGKFPMLDWQHAVLSVLKELSTLNREKP